ncbi:MAG: virulence protein [Prevotellaceae bacterium]|jgi:virulence-associated protein VapD|nr:virulence protein [Prevotellaceae bacterium]
MFAVAFDMVVADLEQFYGNPYHKAYYEIKGILKAHQFDWVQGSTYITVSDDLSVVFDAINALSDIDWFARSVRDVRAFKVENWSDFTASVKRKIKN